MRYDAERCTLVTDEVVTAKKVVRFTPREASAFALLWRNAGKVVSRCTLADVLDHECEGKSYWAVNFYLHMIRRKTSGFVQIEKIPRRGYRLVKHG